MLTAYRLLIISAAATLLSGCALHLPEYEHHYNSDTSQSYEMQEQQEPYQLVHYDYSNCKPNGKFKIRIHH